ncbi:unnamed protein product [Polarella glacialis]|uniref:Uncharacterized protein n=1 Tax=Polarella glacialis TaxID=89957 RepID=A0A813HEZ6_POLGL|nr:unnamed protein product [Polarella glacialis]CAE8673627.1 unnamed protein product [Polarella glacialis]
MLSTNAYFVPEVFGLAHGGRLPGRRLLALHPSVDESLFQRLFRSLFALIRGYRLQPQLWSFSQAVELDKAGHRVGCGGKRLVHLLDPIGKSYNRALWLTATHPIPSFATGFTPHRRREQSILHLNCLMWRLNALGLSWFALLFDMSSAFPSPSFSALDRIVHEDCSTLDADLITQRYRRAFWLLSKAGEELLLAPGSGDLQGDATAPLKFARLFNPLVKRWRTRTGTTEDDAVFLLRDPLSQRRVHTGLLAFADDLCRLSLFFSGQF